MDKCKPLGGGAQSEEAPPFNSIHSAQVRDIKPYGQGLTLVHFSAQRKDILWDTFGAWLSPSLLDRGTRVGNQNGLC